MDAFYRGAFSTAGNNVSSSDSFEQPSNGPSLTSRLLQVASDYESNVKRERAALDARLDSLRVSNAGLDSENRVLREDLSAANSAKKRLEAEIAVGDTASKRRMMALESALIRTRLELANATSSLSLLHGQIAECARAVCSSFVAGPSLLNNDENAQPGAGALASTNALASAPAMSAAESLLLKLVPSVSERAAAAASARAHSRWSADHLIESATRGDEAALDEFLHPRADDTVIESPCPNRVKHALTKALRSATRAGQASSMRRLLLAGAALTTDGISEPLDNDDILMRGLLHLACMSGSENALRVVLNRDSSSSPATPVAPLGGLSVDDRDAYGRTPLHLAAASDHSAVAYLLIMCGADPTVRDVQGLTPADVAAGTLQYNQGGRAPASSVGYSYFVTGELGVNPPAPKAAAILSNKNSLFWNAGYRENRYYNEKRYQRAIEAYSIALELAPQCSETKAPRDMATLHYNRARAWYRMGSHFAAIEDCSSALNHDRSYRNALAQRAECHMSLFDFERAQRDFQALMDADPTDRQWGRRLVDARMNREMSHYGVLGVPRDAEPSVIKRAYRALCLRWHPDKQDPSASNLAPERMIRSNAAFRVRLCDLQAAAMKIAMGEFTLILSRRPSHPHPSHASQRITDAYETLSDQYKRMLYDMEPRSNSARGAESFDSFSTRERDREVERERDQQQAAALETARVLEIETKMAAAQKRYRDSLLSLAEVQPSILPVQTKKIPAVVESDPPTVFSSSDNTANPTIPIASTALPSENDSLPGFISSATAARPPLAEASVPGINIHGDGESDVMDDDELLRSLEEAGGDLASLFSQEGFAARLRATASAWDEEAANWAARADAPSFNDDIDAALDELNEDDEDDDIGSFPTHS